MKVIGLAARDIAELGRLLNQAQPEMILSIYFDPKSRRERYGALLAYSDSHPKAQPHVMAVVPWPNGRPPSAWSAV